MYYKTVFFDWGGVIADDPGDEFLGKLLTEIGATEAQKQAIFESYMMLLMKGEISEANYWSLIKDRYNLAVYDNISNSFKRWKGLVANQSILNLAKEMKDKGLKIAILSNVIEPTYNVIEKAGHYDIFDEVIASCKVGYAKPQKEIYSLALEQLGTTARQSIFIDDKQAYLDPATDIGMTTILAQNPDQIIKDLYSIIG